MTTSHLTPIRRATRCLAFSSCILLLDLLSAAGAFAQSGEKYVYPEVDLGVLSFKTREQTQKKVLAASTVRHDFKLTDRQAESGIDFLHRIVDDAGRDYKPVHYDHGNGIAVADVDGDGLEDIYFVTQLGSNQLWKNLGGGKFRNITEQAGVGLADRVGVTASFADVDNDGDADLFVSNVRMGNVLFENDGHGKFRDVSNAAGIDYVGHSSGAVFFDFDRDGLLDLFLSNVGVYTGNKTGGGGYYIGFPDAFDGHLKPERSERSILYRNLGALKFADVSESMQLVDTSWTGDASFTDLNRDGFPDLYVLNMQGDDHYYENLAGKRFEDKTAKLFPKTPWGTMGIKLFDFNNDGLLDLYLTDMHSDMIEEVPPNREKIKPQKQWTKLQGGDNNILGNAFYVNLGEGRFEERSDALGVENYWPWGLSAGDLNADGYQDLFVTSSMNYPFRYGVNSLFLNEGGQRFLDAEFVVGAEPRRDGKTNKPWFDLDCGGADKTHQHCQGHEGQRTVYGTLGTRSSAIFDLDHDGDLDIVTNEFNAEPLVLVSDLAAKGDLNFLQVRLVGKTGNRDGLGAWVEVKAGDQTLTAYHDGKSGYLSQSRLPLYFGLGKADKVERLDVVWPSGKRQVVERVKINSTVVVEEK